MPKTINDSLVDDQILNCFETHAQSPGLKVHLTPKNFFAKIVKLILWSKLAQKFFDLVKSSSFYAPSKPSFEWFMTVHGNLGRDKAVTSNSERMLHLSQSGLLFCTSVEAILRHKFFAGTPQSTDFCF